MNCPDGKLGVFERKEQNVGAKDVKKPVSDTAHW